MVPLIIIHSRYLHCSSIGCCPSETTLKKLSLKFYGISLTENLWSTIKQYKERYDCFDLYVSFFAQHNLQQLINDTVLSDKEVTFHFETAILRTWSRETNRILHVYTLPFVSEQLYGFTSCSELSTQCSYSTVRHLYCAKDQSSQNISFQSLGKRMPIFLSIHFDPSICQSCTSGPLHQCQQ